LILAVLLLQSVAARAEVGGTTDEGINAQAQVGYQWADGVTPEVAVGVLTGSQDHSHTNLDYSVVVVEAGFRFVFWPEWLLSPVIAAHLGAGFGRTDSRDWRAQTDYAGDVEIAADIRIHRPFYLVAFARFSLGGVFIDYDGGKNVVGVFATGAGVALRP
jgi:hypothetical protein